MIVCSNCRHTNVTGAIFCNECGAALAPEDSIATHNMKKPAARQSPRVHEAAGMPPPSLADNWVTLHLLDTGQMLPLAERSEFTMGRTSEGQPIMPDIDLSPYQAYANGVSRLHAVIKRGMDAVVLMDLGSQNGTFINGRRLNPNVEQDLTNGDVVALGRLKIQVLLKAA